MNRLQELATVLALVDSLRAKGSWCGETHIQKAVYFLKELARVPLSYDFVLYRHGPFSFDLRDTLGAMRADDMLRVVPQQPYGPSLVPTDFGHDIRGRFPKTLTRHHEAIEFVSQHLGPLDVSALERLATAFYVTRVTPNTPDTERAREVHRLKPHIDLADAEIAVRDVDELLHRAA